jgi:hypothetical protein
MAIINTVLIRWTDHPTRTEYTVLNENLTLNSDLLPPVGIDPDLEVLIPYIPYVIPDYDPRIHYLQTVKEPTLIPDTIYPQINQWKITYNIIKRDAIDIKESIENAKNDSNNLAFPIQKQLEHIVVGLNALKKYVLGQNLSPVELVVNQRITHYANILLANRENEELLKNIVDEDGEPNLNEGWIVDASI